MQDRSTSAVRKLSKLVFYILFLSIPVVFWFNRFTVFDWWRLRNYSAPAEVVSIADKTTMNSASRRVFYANHPELEDSQNLRSNCQQDEITIVLGCYVGGKGIFLFKVTDPRLDGIKEVTGAHELLHAQYDRLSLKEQTRVNNMLSAAFATVTNQRIKDTVEQYRKKDPSIVNNELHSILATEVRNLPPELEEYYKRFFDNRFAIVAFSEQYESEFSSRQAKVKDYDVQLVSLKAKIEKNQEALDSDSSSIQGMRSQLDQQLAANDYTAYNGGVDTFNKRVNSYNRLAKDTSALIEAYNSVVIARNTLAVEVNDLAKAIDTRPQGISTQ